MGTYNYTLVEKLDPISGQWAVENTDNLFIDIDDLADTVDCPFEYQSYQIASFIAGVRNDFEVTPIAADRSLPLDHESSEEVAGWGGQPVTVMNSRYGDFLLDDASYSWVLLSELLDFNYDETFEDRRNYSGTCRDSLPVGKGEVVTYREFLGEHYFLDLSALKGMGQPSEIRIVFKFVS